MTVGKWTPLLAIFLLGLVLRAAFGWHLPLSSDEEGHLNLARSLSLRPLHLPLSSEKTGHPILVVYLTALADRAGSDSVVFIRMAFVALHLVGLVGVFQLARSFFGGRAGLFALAFAALDHHLISYAPQFLEPVYLNLAPWIILAFYQAVAEDQERRWLAVGVLFGIGFLLTEVIVLLTLPLALFVLASRKTATVLKCRRLYAGLGLFLLLVSPYLIWSFLHASANIGRHVERAGSLGISPRALLLYLGGVLMCFRDVAWIYLSTGHQMYSPFNIPCHWLTGFVYAGCVLYSLRFFRDLRYALLLLVFFAIGLTVSVLNAREPWNEFGWASMTVFPAIVLTGAGASRAWDSFPGKIAVSAALAVLAVLSAAFAFGFGFTYETPSWERRFLGRAIAFGFARRSPQEIADLAKKSLSAHPNCAFAWFCLMRYAPQEEERSQAALELERLDPRNPLFVMEKARQLWMRDDRVGARNLMRSLLEEGHRAPSVLKELVLMEFDLENYSEVERLSRTILEMKPDEMAVYRVLFLAQEKMGRTGEAEETLDVLLKKGYVNAYEGYADMARWLAGASEAQKAAAFAEKSLSIRPDYVLAHVVLAIALEQSGREKEAFEHSTRALELEPDSVLALEHLAGWWRRRGRNEEALALYRKARDCAEGQGKQMIAANMQAAMDQLAGEKEAPTQ